MNINFKTYNKLITFVLALDINFGNYTYDKLRLLFAQNVTNELYVIPNDKATLLYEYKRTLSDGLANMVGNINKSIINNPKLILNKFSFEDKNDCINYPIFHALYNSIQNS